MKPQRVTNSWRFQLAYLIPSNRLTYEFSNEMRLSSIAT